MEVKMKIIKSLMLAAAFSMIVGASSAFALALAAPSTTIGTGQNAASAPLSKNVTGAYFGSATLYAATTGHSGGTKTYGTEESATSIYYIVETPNTSAVTSTTFDPAGTTGWTAQ